MMTFIFISHTDRFLQRKITTWWVTGEKGPSEPRSWFQLEQEAPSLWCQ